MFGLKFSIIIEIPKRLINDVIESLAARIRDKWADGHCPSLPEIITAASLAHHGFLRSVKCMRLRDVDLGSVPAEHLASLAASDMAFWDI